MSGSTIDRHLIAGGAPPESDSDLITRSLVEPEAFAAIFDRHFVSIHRYVHRRAGSDLADELAAETFRVAFEARRRWARSTPDVRPWLLGIATNLLRRYRRLEERRLRALSRARPDEWATVDEGAIADRADAARTRFQALFPPLAIGRTTQLAEHGGRTLFGARTARGGYCFSATSPLDPEGEGGHCVSRAEARALDEGRAVAFAMSGGSVGGYAPRASDVRVSGVGLDVTLPVSSNGWWVGEAQLPRGRPRDATVEGLVVATSLGPDGEALARDPLLRVRRANGVTVIAIV